MNAHAAPGACAADKRGTLPDGTPYRVTLPKDWNGVAVRDLDYVNRSESPHIAGRYEDLRRRGFAVIGTMRHRRYNRTWRPS